MFKHAALPLCLLLIGCTPQIAMQTIPVSTDPGGANVAVDGKAACVAPCEVSLARNQDHILTLTRDGYRQQDVIIKRQYQTTKVLVNAINDGAQAANFFDNAWMGANSGVMSMNRQEDTGEAYVLTPSTVSLRLVPVNGFPARTSEEQARQSLNTEFSPLDAMDVSDQQMLENALENSRTGQTTAWTNDRSGVAFSVVPEEAMQNDAGNVERWFTLGARKDGRTATGHYQAYRAGRGEWALALPATPGVPPSDKGADDITRRETLRALGQAPWPSVGKSWDLGSSGSTRTKTSASPDGSSTTTTTTTTKTSVSAGVHANPGALVNVLDALIGE